MLSEGNAAHPVGCGSPLQIVMAVWRPFCWIQNFWVRCDSPLLIIMVHQKAITICRGLSHPTRSLSRIVCRGKERPKGRKGTLRPDILANTTVYLGFFKKPMSPQDTRRQLWGNSGIVSLRQFRDNEAWIQLGQVSPLMNKKGLRETTCWWEREWGGAGGGAKSYDGEKACSAIKYLILYIQSGLLIEMFGSQYNS